MFEVPVTLQNAPLILNGYPLTIEIREAAGRSGLQVTEA
jgi:hypothetical protein